MNWSYPDQGPYVDTTSSYPLHPTTPLQSTSSFWPTPSTQSGLTPLAISQPSRPPQESVQRNSLTLQTPPSHVSPLQRHFTPGQPASHAVAMADPRRMSSTGQRPVMGPPETPSRGMIHASPTLFPTPLFSPDMFNQQHMEPQSAPVYPQQRLFWDPASTPLTSTPQQFHTPTAFPDHFTASFDSNATIMQPVFPVSQDHHQSFELPDNSHTMHMTTSFINPSPFPAPFQTSPNLRAPQPENPTQFLSSPARRFGVPEINSFAQARRAQPELPAYYHQIEEARREKEASVRKRSRATKRVADEDLVMKSVRRALSPKKPVRPELQRSNTHSGVKLHALAMRRPSQVTFADAVSVASNTSSRSGTGSKVSPSRHSARRQSSSSVARPRSSMSLAIDDHGVARTIMTSLPDDDDEMETDDSVSEVTTEEGDDQHMLYSFTGEDYDSSDLALHDDARDHLEKNAYLSMGSDRVARVRNIDPRLTGDDPMATIKASRRQERSSTLITASNSTTSGKESGNAKQALRAIIQNRSRSASSHGGQSSNSSVQFHSSPPIQQGQLPTYSNVSPTTITDPDLATPSTDADSISSKNGMRCVCHSRSPDGNIMIQCDNCNNWLHAKCLGLHRGNLPEIYVCVFCEQSQSKPYSSARQSSSRNRNSLHSRSPLAHKGPGMGTFRH